MTFRREPAVALFDRLDAWRHLPAYQLERRADIFFSLYLREVVEGELGVQLLDAVLPEVPIKQPHSDQSFKVDYLLTTTDRERAFLVELKTDPRSRRTKQDDYLRQAVESGMESMLDGIRSIMTATSEYKKYYHLLQELVTIGYLHAPNDLADFIFPEARRGLTQKLRAIAVGTHRPKLEVVFVQPLHGSCPERVIDFETFSRYVARHDDVLSQRFSESLLRWRGSAGEREAAGEVARGDRVS